MKIKLTNLNIQVSLAISAASALIYEVNTIDRNTLTDVFLNDDC